MTNFDLCEKVYAVLTKLQVETVVICAGARNAALIENLREQKFKAIYFFEERSAAFYALGLVKQSGKPVAVITTSGTAAAELLPAAIEAFYQNLPLILVTADRPQVYRDTGSPQAINQVGIYSHYVKQSFDWDCEQDYFDVKTALQGPIHFNVCFDEPLLDKPSVAEQPVRVEVQKKIQFPVATEQQWDQVQDPLLIIGQIPDDKRNEVLTLIKKLKAPVYLEALSQMHGDSTISEWVLESSEVLIKKLFQEKICKSIVRVGAVPTVRFWRDLESQFKTVPVFNFTDLPFAGLARSSENYCVDFSNAVKFFENTALDEVKVMDQKLQEIKKSLYLQFPNSEQACVYHLSKAIGEDSIYLGNSLPIREWDLFSDREVPNKTSQSVYANRGANGIDGQVSTYLGWCENKVRSWCLVGDLTAMYDLAALGLASSENPWRKHIVIMNNCGGHIFKRVFNKPQFLNTHEIEFKGWAEMWNWNYVKISSAADFAQLNQLNVEKVIIEIRPDLKQSEDFWNRWDQACKEI